MRLVTILLIVAGGLALAALPLTSAALIVAGGAIVIATLIRPEVSLYLLVFAVPFGSLRSVSFGGMSLTATEVLVALLAVAWLMRGVLRRNITIPHAPLILPFAFILVTQILSLFDALSLSLAAKELIKWTEILVVYIITASILCEDAGTRGRGDVESNVVCASARPRVLVLLLLVAALAEALLGVYQFLLRAGPASFQIGSFMRAYGTFSQPNPFAGYLNLSLPLGYALLLAHLECDDSRRRGILTLRTGLLVLWLAIVGGAELMSFSRGAWLGFAVAFVAITLLYSRRTAVLAIGAGVLVAAVLILGSANLLPSAITERFTSVTDYFRVFDVRHVKVTDANFAVVERMAHWQAAWGMIQDRPWLGYGVGNYPAAYPQYALAGWKEPLGHAHNILLNVTAETGLVGLSAYLFFLAAALWMCWRAALQCPPAPNPGGDTQRPPAPNSGADLQQPRTAPPQVSLTRPIGHWGDRGAVIFAHALALGVLGVLAAKITHEMLDNLWVHSMGVQIAMLLAMVPMNRHKPQ